MSIKGYKLAFSMYTITGICEVFALSIDIRSDAFTVSLGSSIVTNVQGQTVSFTKSRIDCAKHCGISSQCCAASFSESSKECVMDKCCAPNTESSGISAFIQKQVTCNQGVIRCNQCYFFSSDAKTWADSQQQCANRGGHVIGDELEDQTTYDFVVDHAKSLGSIYHYYTSGYFDHVTSAHYWKNSVKPILTLRWGMGQPGVNEDCIYLEKMDNYRYHDVTCGASRRYICVTDLF